MSTRLQNAVAIIGMAARLPGAETPEEYWQNLMNGREAIERIAESDLEDGLSPAERAQGSYVAARALLRGVDLFDAGFFQFLPREAELTDPQQRLLLECAWRAFEDAGYDPVAVAGSVGVYAGSSINTYLLLNLASDARFRQEFTRSYQVGSFAALTGNGQDFLATRISYKLNLRGPAMTVQSACSTGLLAVAQAWQSLMNYQCDLALAGAASISFPQRRGYFYQEGGMVAPDGHCRPFDRNAAGTVFGSGGGMVLLKRAEDAVRDGDHIYALLLGAGVNNDGADKMGYAAPSSAGQAEAVAQAYAVADVDPASVGYIECHGTGTPLGDPIEVAALRQVFGAGPRQRPCVLGSAKGNIGHIDVAAGIAGLMKAALALDRGSIPGTLHYTAPNLGLDIEKTPFAISAAVTPWPRGEEPRRAGVSAFGVGGTNVHVVLEEAPAIAEASVARPVELFCLSARSEAALAQQCENLAAYLDDRSVNLADIAWTLAVGRRHFPYRLAFAAAGHEQLRERLLDPARRKKARRAGAENAPVTFLFPGQGAQYAGMGAELYRTQAVYRAAVDACGEIAAAEGLDLRALLLAAPGSPAGAAAAAQLEETEFAQPALFATGYALAQLWKSWGVTPSAVAGHSLGEITAATIAGIFSLEDGLRLAIRRGQWMQQTPAGRMLAVRMQPELLQMRLPETLNIAAMNSPEITVVSGPEDVVVAFEAQLAAAQVVTMRLGAQRAFHSRQMQPVAAALAAWLHGVALQAPKIPLFSTVTGEVLTPAQATSPDYWAEQAVQPVNFSAAVQSMLRGSEVFLEAGPGDLLCGLMRAHLPRRSEAAVLPSLPAAAAAETASAWATLSVTAGALWMRGLPIAWSGFYAGEARRRVPLPTYPFERKRYWIDPAPSAVLPEVAAPAVALPSQPDTPVADVQKAAESIASPIQEPFMPAPQSQHIAAILEELSGLELPASEYATSFLELGFDSLLLTQVAQRLQSDFGVKLGFRQLLDDLSSVDALAGWIAAHVPSTAPTTAPVATPAATPSGTSVPVGANPSPSDPALQQMQAAIESLQRQLQMLAGSVPAPAAPASATHVPAAAVPAVQPVERNTLHARPVLRHEPMTAEQKQFVAALTDRWCRRTAKSKAYTAAHRPELADPRVVSGFRPEWKEMVYSIVSSRSHGSKLWDIDGNEYVDLLNGFGPNMFGHSPEFVTRAIAQQMAEGFAIGPQTPLAGEAARMLAEMTGCDRVTFCNTGSEAVMAAMRLARTVTGRDRIVYFAGDYHGQFDEVLGKALRRKGEFAAQPAAPGIPRNSLENIVVLDYGTDESLRYLEEHAATLAAILVEPVQSRHPYLQPKEFLEKLRALTRRSGTALIFDEVVNGFRIHPRGAQGYYGIDADMVTYGKVVAGGMPIGILAGSAAFMDALDGGPWNFGDDSVPEKGVTFFAGTFVRHPLTMAALCATLRHIREQGPELYRTLNETSERFAARMRAVAEASGSQITLENCGSVMFLRVPPEYRFAGLLFYLLREKGVFLLEGFPLYLTTAHTEQDLNHVVDAFTRSIAEMQHCGLLPGSMPVVAAEPLAANELPLTEPQLEILLAAQASPEASSAFNESFRITLDGPLDQSALERAWDALVERHDALRMSLSATGDRMRVDPERRIPLVAQDAGNDPEAGLERLLAEDGKTPFDLQGALVRARLVALGPQRHVIVVTAHHLVCDGWSVNVLIQELGRLYTAQTSGDAPGLPPSLAFSAYALQTQAPESLAAEAADLEYWKQQLTPLPELQTLPADTPRPEQRAYTGATLITTFPPELTQALRKTGASSGCTLFTTLLGAWNILLWRLSGNADGITMIPAAAQSQLGDQVLVGHCVHLLPIRRPIGPAMSAKQYLTALKPVVLDAYEHQRATYGRIVRAVAPPRVPGRLPLSEVQFNLEQMGRNANFAGLAANAQANPKRAVNFDLFLNIVDTREGLRLECDYSTALYRESTVRLWLAAYRTLLEAMVADAGRSVAELPIVPAPVAERLDALNATTSWPLPAASVPEMIANAFSRNAEQPAADFYGLEMSRKELADRSDRLAGWLLRHNVRQGSLVGIYMDRSLEMLVAILGVLKAGAAYVPLDPIFPAARIGQIVAETQLPVMLTLTRHLDALPGAGYQSLALDGAARQLELEPVPELPRIAADALAYVIFTSGSTGKPKGVEVTHGAVVNLLADLGRRLDMRAEDRWLAVTTLSFDIAVLELLLPLVTGGTVVIAHRDDVADGMRLLELIEAARITTLQATPITWRMLVEQGFQPSAGFKMLCGGEAWPVTLAAGLLAKPVDPPARMWNMYGPTETTVWSSVTAVKSEDAAVLIGPPLANTRFYVLDERLQPVLPGTPGELCIAGAGVARGYFHRPELTAERFLPDPFLPGERLYRTGDEVRQSMEGNILFLGRLDHQVKLRGYRLELGEVEAGMRAFSGVTGAVVTLRNGPDGEQYLAGYYTVSGEISAADLKQFLRDRLPAYMIPAMLWQLDQFPLTPNGKVDRRALPDIRTAAQEVKSPGEVPQGPTETLLAAIICEVLGRDRIGRDENLLELGADSLRMFQIASRAHRRGLPVTARQLLQLHTIEAVAAALDANPQTKTAALTGVGPQLGPISRENYRVTW